MFVCSAEQTFNRMHVLEGVSEIQGENERKNLETTQVGSCVLRDVEFFKLNSLCSEALV